MANINIGGIKGIQRRLRKLQNIDPTTLMLKMEKQLAEDNRKGLMAGLDKDDNPLDPVTYRPRREVVNIRSASADSKRMRNGAKGNGRQGTYSGFGPAAAGLHNNLSRDEYLSLDGPPLIPRRAFSRAITNFVTSHFPDATRRVWKVIAGWRGVVSVRGVPFLKHLFKKRNIRGVRPSTMRRLQSITKNWLKDLLRSRGI